jgi:signal peptidase I
VGRRRSLIREYTEAALVAVLFLCFANTFVVQTFYIPSGSMRTTLVEGDRLFVNRFIYGPELPGRLKELLPARSVRRGDVVVFRSPEDPTLDVVKRCVALPGDEVEIADGTLRINGLAVDESLYATADRRDMPPRRVPADSYFCLGDNRPNSYDSRFWGPLPAHLVKGRAVLVFWSLCGEPARSALGAVTGFFHRTCWERILRPVR